MSLPVVAIVGRPNVGKSSLFNRFIQRRKAVVDPISGVTRDRNYALCDWNGREFRIVDTGGIVPGSKDGMEQAIQAQSEFAIEESDLVLLVIDAQSSLDQSDQLLARILLRSKKPVILVSNKVDSDEQESGIFEAVNLGLGEPLPTSATVGRGVGDLLDRLVDMLPAPEPSPSPEGTNRVALVGRPNV